MQSSYPAGAMIDGFGSRWAVGIGVLFLCSAVSSGVVAEEQVSSRQQHKKPALQAAPASGAGPFSVAELRRLDAGKSVKRKFTIRTSGAVYHAGYSYRVVQTSPMEVIRLLRRPGELIEVIPYGLSAQVLSEKDGVSRMRIAQGKRPVVGEYTVRLEWDLREYQARFWMDPAYDHDLEDVWGVFSAREIRPGFTLISFGFAFNIGGVGTLLERKAQNWGLTTADRIAKRLNQP